MSRSSSSRALTALAVLFVSISPLVVDVAHAVYIPLDDIDPFNSPCTLDVSQQGSTRTLTWSAVSGASTYKVGYRQCDGTVVGLAEVTATTYDHTGWNANECLEYVMVAYDSSGQRICSAHKLNVGADCPCTQ